MNSSFFLQKQLIVWLNRPHVNSTQPLLKLQPWLRWLYTQHMRGKFLFQFLNECVNGCQCVFAFHEYVNLRTNKTIYGQLLKK